MIVFAKYVAAGNDFIVCDQLPQAIDVVCDRRQGIGADGLIWLEGDLVHFFNQDGSRAFCCGNGLRVAAIHAKKTVLKTALGEHQVKFFSGGCRVSYPDPRKYHKVIEVEDPRAISHEPIDINCNYVKVIQNDRVLMKTIERGVGETSSCGSGAIATFLELNGKKRVGSNILAEFTSGETLLVEWKESVTWLEGPVRQVFLGTLS